MAMCGGDGVVSRARGESAGGDRTVALAVAESSGEDAARLLCCAIDASGTRVAAAGWAPEAVDEGPGDPPGPSNARGPFSMKASSAAHVRGEEEKRAPPQGRGPVWDAAARREKRERGEGRRAAGARWAMNARTPERPERPNALAVDVIRTRMDESAALETSVVVTCARLSSSPRRGVESGKVRGGDGAALDAAGRIALPPSPVAPRTSESRARPA